MMERSDFNGTYRPWMTKGGHPQFKSAPPQLRNIADNYIEVLRTKKKLRNCDCRASNLTSAIPQLYTVSCQFRYFLVPFPQLRMVLKINQKYF
jgi:hypothetical protein